MWGFKPLFCNRQGSDSNLAWDLQSRLSVRLFDLVPRVLGHCSPAPGFRLGLHLPLAQLVRVDVVEKKTHCIVITAVPQNQNVREGSVF